MHNCPTSSSTIFARIRRSLPLHQRSDNQRERRLILWGCFSKGTDPSTTAQKRIASVCESIKGNCVAAQWLRAKSSKSIMGILVSLPSCDHVAEVVSKRLLILGKYSHIRNVSLDYPTSQRAKWRCSEPPTLPLSDEILSSTKYSSRF